ncbi:hypothetical protein N7470_000698 [Penicillium chermesinum]|nr:hypothetical protein N7470_000698 [Penicillium chermesinum]
MIISLISFDLDRVISKLDIQLRILSPLNSSESSKFSPKISLNKRQLQRQFNSIKGLLKS